MVWLVSDVGYLVPGLFVKQQRRRREHRGGLSWQKQALGPPPDKTTPEGKEREAEGIQRIKEWSDSTHDCPEENPGVVRLDVGDGVVQGRRLAV